MTKRKDKPPTEKKLNKLSDKELKEISGGAEGERVDRARVDRLVMKPTGVRRWRE